MFLKASSKFEYSHYLFAEYCKDIMGKKDYMLISSGS